MQTNGRKESVNNMTSGWIEGRKISLISSLPDDLCRVWQEQTDAILAVEVRQWVSGRISDRLWPHPTTTRSILSTIL